MNSMKRAILLLALVAGLLFLRGAQAILIDRGNGLIYDTVLNVTWLQDANLANQTFDWQAALDWADNLAFGGFDDWRLPSMDVNGDGVVVSCSTNVDCPDNEYGHMYYQNLDGVLFGEGKLDDEVGDGGVTINDIRSLYWSGTEFSDSNFAWAFFFFGTNLAGLSDIIDKDTELFVWAVRDGDVLNVQEPLTLALLTIGLAGLGFFRCKPS